MITRDMAETIAKPTLTKAYSQIKGGIIMHHGGYKVVPYLDIYKDLPNILGFIIDSKDRLLDAREKTGDQMVIAGNIEGPTLDRRTPDQIAKISANMLKVMDNHKHFILSTSAADVPYDTSEEQIMALMNAPRIYAEAR